jgi:hypothetical protein
MKENQFIYFLKDFFFSRASEFDIIRPKKGKIPSGYGKCWAANSCHSACFCSAVGEL